MDTIYGTKKYFQSLSGTSDIYRSSACRPLHTQMSYQATMGRRPAFGAYHHMNNQPPAPYEINNAYNLNTWTMGREVKSLAPSIYSNTTKFGRNATTSRHQHHHRKSFSIILTTAAFILLLAVLTVAALAYYISSIRMHIDDSMLGFEGSFQISKGDAFTRGLKYNHTTTFKQKTEFYKRFLERALTDNGLVPLHTEVNNFGEGPLIQVTFRTIIDVRKLPQNENGVEDLIKECIFLETVAEKSLYRYLKIDMDSIEVKRIFNDKSSKSAFDSAEKMVNPMERRVLKKVNKNYLNLVSRPDTTTTKNIIRTTTTHENADVDNINAKIENAPVVHGSFEGFFEITKTDADITHTKVAPTKAYSTLAAKAITPHFLRVRNKKPAIEKVNIKNQQETTTIPTTSNTKSATATSTTVFTTKKATTTSTTKGPTVITTTEEIKTTVSPKTGQILLTNPSVQSTSTITMMTTTKLPPNESSFKHVQHLTLPQLTTSTKQPFTTFPILDTQPWRPIHREELLPGPPPAYPTKTIAFSQDKISNMDQTQSPDSNYQFNYSFNRFAPLPFMDIERLGAGSQIQPHPLPISLIDEVIPSFKPITEVNNISEFKENSTAQVRIVETSEPKEHIIEYNTTPIELSTETTSEKIIAVENNLSKSNNNVVIESQQDSENITIATKKPYLWNMREVILKRNQVKIKKNETDRFDERNSIADSIQHNTSVSLNRKNIVNKMPITLDDSFLFPSHSKWQFVNSSSNHNNNNYSTISNLRKVFNKTLQALVSEDIKGTENMTTLNEIKTRINNVTNLQDISHIFDTLASKLGVTSTISTKIPPVSHNKFKQQVKIENLTKPQVVKEVEDENQDDRLVVLTSVKYEKPTVSSFIEMHLQQREETQDENTREGIGAAIPVFGEAEVEHMDPTKYEELLRSTNFAETSSSSRESIPELVTLLPVRSNSAVRVVSQ